MILPSPHTVRRGLSRCTRAAWVSRLVSICRALVAWTEANLEEIRESRREFDSAPGHAGPGDRALPSSGTLSRSRV
jgi:hypothetical protein